jgi:hypothetical protein
MGHFSRALALLVPLAAAGCFSSSSSSPGDSTSAGDDASADATVPDSSGSAPDGASPSLDGGALCDGGAPCSADAASPPVVCHPSTCTAVKVVFQGWIVGADGGTQTVEITADTATPDGGTNGTVVRTTSAPDGGLGSENLLVGDFVASADGGIQSPLLYANDNNYCDVPDFGGRTNEYYLVPLQGLPLDVTLFQPSPCGCGGSCGAPCVDGGGGGSCDFESEFYSQTCPNFGGNCVVTPRKVEAIQVLAVDGDPTCRVCLYGDGAAGASSPIRCVAPGTTLTAADLSAAAADSGTPSVPAMLRLDDGSSCAFY